MQLDWDFLIIPIYFFYGLAFYSMGLALFVESGRASELGFARSMRLLAGFGLLHGLHEWLDFLDRSLYIYNQSALPLWLQWLRVAVLATSFIALVAFGENLRAADRRDRVRTWLVVLAVLWYAGSCVVVQSMTQLDEARWIAVCDVLARYVLGIPASVLAGLVLFRQRKSIQHLQTGRFDLHFTLAAVSILIYGLVGQVFVQETVIFPATVINQNLFLAIAGFPIQLLRAGIAVVLSVSMIGVLRVLEVENEQRLAAVEQNRREELSRLNASLQASEAEARELLAELKKRDTFRTGFLQQVTAAQESERQRIARELHDGTGQMLTGLALGLRGLSLQVHKNPDLVVKRLSELETMATTTIGELRALIQDLRPPQLDDMGLIPAIRSMLERVKATGAPPFDLKIAGDPYPLPAEVETILFRVVQEGVTNITKHAHATQAAVCLDYSDGVRVCVCDNGVGCDPALIRNPSPTRQAWGLVGIEERVNLINATWTLESEPNKGTRLQVYLPRLAEETANHDD